MYLGGGGTYDLRTLAALRVHELWLHALLAARSELLRKRPNVAWRWVTALGGGVGSAILAAVISLPSSPSSPPLSFFSSLSPPPLPPRRRRCAAAGFFFGVGWWDYSVGSHWSGVGWCWVLFGGVG